jgi:hypothetical protein
MNAVTDARPIAATPAPWDPLSHVAHRHTISRELAHKRRLENVYVTSLSPAARQDEFLFGAFVPQSNVYINGMRTHANDVTLSIVEIGRQIGIALSHEYLNVGSHSAFVLDRMVFETMPALHTQDWRAQETVWGHATISQQVHNAAGELTSAQADGAIHAQERCICTQSSQWSILPRDRYQRLREIARTRFLRHPGAKTDVAPLGPGFMVSLDTTTQQPVLEPGLFVASSGNRFVATLHVDRQNLFFFDHDNDHVPGMLVLEGMRAMAVDIVGKFRGAAQAAQLLRRIEVSFKNFAELDAPVQLVATLCNVQASKVGGPLSLHIEARQLDRCFATGDFLATAA